jgi:hypothetical protein
MSAVEARGGHQSRLSCPPSIAIHLSSCGQKKRVLLGAIEAGGPLTVENILPWQMFPMEDSLSPERLPLLVRRTLLPLGTDLGTQLEAGCLAEPGGNASVEGADHGGRIGPGQATKVDSLVRRALPPVLDPLWAK